MQTEMRLHQLFATILLFCTPSQPDQLWYQYCTYICDDLPYRLCALSIKNVSDDIIYNYGLYMIDHILHESGHSIADWPSMPILQQHWEQYTANEIITEQLNYDRNIQHAY
jgi:hypothetical protein